MYVRVLQNKARLKLLPSPPRRELLRLREVQQWLGICRDYVELLEREGRITPFRKTKRAKAWYQTNELCADFEIFLPITRPHIELLRRADVLDWLGVPAAEFQSWIRCGIISAHHPNGPHTKAYYLRSEIECKVLGYPQL
jgi:hypothetical protein